jgi:hypothetical protein
VLGHCTSALFEDLRICTQICTQMDLASWQIIALNHSAFLGGEVDKGILWLSFAQHKS